MSACTGSTRATGRCDAANGSWSRSTTEPWELYDMQADRTELHDLAAAQPQTVKDLLQRYEAFAEKWGIRPFNELPLPAKAKTAPAR